MLTAILTERQQQIAHFIDKFLQQNGYFPSVREIAQAFHIQPNGVQGHLKALEKKDVLCRTQGKVRAFTFKNKLKPVPPAPPPPPSFSLGGFKIALVAKIPAGLPSAVEETPWNSIEINTDWFAKGDIVAVQIDGQSMQGDSICDGDIALLRLQKTASPHDIVAVRIFSEEITLKRIKQDGEFIILHPSNPDFDDRRVPATQVEIIGKYVGLIRKP